MSHLKRIAAPKTWDILRKEGRFIVRNNPGPHSLDFSLPLIAIIRDTLGIVKNARESKKVLADGQVIINGKKGRGNDFSVGLMDIIEIPLTKKMYKMTIDARGKLVPQEIQDATERLCRIEGKTKIAGGKMQLNLFGGENVIVNKDEYKIGDVIKIGLKDHKVTGSIVLSNGVSALIIGGSHIGKTATIKGIDKSITPAEIVLDSEDKKEIRTRFCNVYPIA